MANNSNMASGSRVTTAQVKFWDSDSVEIHDGRLRKDIPEMPKIKKSFQVVYGGYETLCYLALQVLKTQNKDLIMRCIASACAIYFDDKSNFTGSPTQSVAITGLDVLIDEAIVDRTQVITTNLEMEETVTIAEMDSLMETDPDEIGSYFGVLCLAGVKAINRENRTAFNEKRQSAAQSTTIGDLRIFVTDSSFLAPEVLQKVYASFNSFLPIRSHIVANCVDKIERSVMGSTLAFVTMFLLLADQGMSALRIIKEALVKHAWIVTEFPEIRPELEVANEGFAAIARASAKTRSFLKAIHGSTFVPVSYHSIANATGLCKFVLKETTVSYARYSGGQVTDGQEAKLIAIMVERGLMRNTNQTKTVAQE